MRQAPGRGLCIYYYLILLITRGRDPHCWKWGNRGQTSSALSQHPAGKRREDLAQAVPGLRASLGFFSVGRSLSPDLAPEQPSATCEFSTCRATAETVWALSALGPHHQEEEALTSWLSTLCYVWGWQSTRGHKDQKNTDPTFRNHMQIFQISFRETEPNYPGLPGTEGFPEMCLLILKSLPGLPWWHSG